MCERLLTHVYPTTSAPRWTDLPIRTRHPRDAPARLPIYTPPGLLFTGQNLHRASLCATERKARGVTRDRSSAQAIRPGGRRLEGEEAPRGRFPAPRPSFVLFSPSLLISCSSHAAAVARTCALKTVLGIHCTNGWEVIRPSATSHDSNPEPVRYP